MILMVALAKANSFLELPESDFGNRANLWLVVGLDSRSRTFGKRRSCSLREAFQSATTQQLLRLGLPIQLAQKQHVETA